MGNEFRLPENAEASVVGCVLLYPGMRPQAAKLLNEADFRSPFFAAAFTAAMELKEPDSAVFRELMRERGIELPDGFFRDLCDLAIVPANLELYAALLREESRKRDLWALSQGILEAVEGGRKSEEILAEAAARLREIERPANAAELASPADAAAAFFDHRERVEAGQGAIPTGFGPLDAILGGGMLRSGMYVLAGRPGMGKTTLGLQIADSVAERAGAVLFVSLEMAVEQIQGKRLARLTGIPSDQILLGDGEGLDYRRIMDASEVLRQRPVYISRRPTATVAQIRRMAMQVPDLQLVAVDYLGRIAPSARRASRYEAITDISAELKALAVELNVPLLALAQLNRENAAREDKRPQLSDLRDSGAIEQDADAVVMLHRKDYYVMAETPMRAQAVEMEIIVRKNRHGNIGTCKAGFFTATGKIVKQMGESA